VGIVRRHYWEASSSTIQNHSTTRTTHSFLYIDLTQPQVTSRLVHDPYSGLSPLSHPSHCLYSGRPASMSSIPDILSGVDLIPHLDSPASMTPSPRPGSPTQPGLGLGPGPHRSKTAPPPGPPPPPDFPSPVHAPLISSDASSPTQGDAAPTVPPPRTGALAANTASTSVSTSTSTPASASRPQVSPKHNPSALRRSSSSLSSSSNPGTGGSREKKRLRFTPVHHGEPESSSAAPSNENSDEDVFFPGQGYSLAERGEWRGHGHGHGRGHGGEYEGGKCRSGTRGIPRDQVDYLRSDPGTPNISET
jgi:hypothetical protein